MFSKIMWATDGSEAAAAALPQVRELASTNGSTLVVAHCEQTFVGPRAYGLPVNVDEEDVIEEIRKQAEALADEGFEVETEIVHGDGVAAHVIAEVAEKDGVDLIVVGTRGHSALGGLLLGSVTQRLLQVAPCPVLAVPVH